MYSRSIRSSIPSHSRSSVFRFTRLRPFCESALLKEESTHEDRSLGSADLFHVALALDNVLCLFIDLAAGREITESLHLVAISSERFFDSIGERNEALILAKANSYQFARNFPEFTRKKNFISKQSEKIEIQRIPIVSIGSFFFLFPLSKILSLLRSTKRNLWLPRSSLRSFHRRGDQNPLSNEASRVAAATGSASTERSSRIIIVRGASLGQGNDRIARNTIQKESVSRAAAAAHARLARDESIMRAAFQF